MQSSFILAANAILNHQLVLMHTETVLGFAASYDPKGAQALQSAKMRPPNKPFLALSSCQESLLLLVAKEEKDALRQAFETTKTPTSFVVRPSDNVISFWQGSSDALGQEGKIALRWSQHPSVQGVTQALQEKGSLGVFFSTSANRSGEDIQDVEATQRLFPNAFFLKGEKGSGQSSKLLELQSGRILR